MSDSVFSLDDIDKIIEVEDPSFKNELSEIQKQSVEGTDAIESLKLEPEEDTESGKEDDEQLSKRKKLFLFLFKPILGVQSFVRLRWIRIKNRALMSIDRLSYFVRSELPDRIKYTWSQLRRAFAWLLKQWANFRAFNSTQKLAVAFMALALAASVFFISKTFDRNWLPTFAESLPHSLAQGASFVGVVHSKSELEDLFQVFPKVEYYVLLKKVIVNLQPSYGSGPNPMGAFQIFVGADSQDTAIEVKAREQQILDLVRRTLETFNYNEAASVEGKERMKIALREQINKILDQGRVFNIYFNNFILYSGN